MAEQDNFLITKVAEIYDWLDEQIRESPTLAGKCNICGACCDFDYFDNRLFITTPEFFYLYAKLGKEKIKSMPANKCPYNIAGKCAIYEYRFAGCRIFCCRADKNFQSALSESAVKKFKSLCDEFQIHYSYTDLATMLNSYVKTSNIYQLVKGYFPVDRED